MESLVHNDLNEPTTLVGGLQTAIVTAGEVIEKEG
jgi:hypothetical protein